MCKYSVVLLSLIYLTSTLSANGFVIHGGFNAVFGRVVSSQTQSNVQSYRIQGLNSFYGSDYRNDLAEVERSIGRLLDPGRYSDEEFRFEKPAYNVTTTTNYIGLMTAFKLVTSLKNTVQYGLLTDDAYVNQVFRIGPTTGLLYSDTKLKKGVYNFEITADIIDLQRHATANVTVNVTQPTPKISSAVEIYPILKISPNQKNQILEETGEDGSDSPQNYEKVTTERTEEFFSYIPYEFPRNVAKEDPKNPFSSWWRGLVQRNFENQRTNDRALNKEQLEKSLSSWPQIKLIVPHEHLRYQRAIPQGVYAVSFDETSTTPADNATVTSIKIHEESLLVDHVMSSFILFVSTFGVVILLGSLVYFIYKRIKKCGDYSVDDDNNYKYVDGPLKKEIILRSDLKNPHFLCVNEINQKRVTDSIEITKSKLQGHPPSVFTIQKCYEDHQLQQTARRKSSSADDDVFIVDMSQMSTHSQDDDVYNTITLQSFTNSTPAITATLIGAPPPVSILSSSRRSSIVSTKRDGSMNSEEMGPNGEMRRKSVTFSDIVELYQIKGAE